MNNSNIVKLTSRIGSYSIGYEGFESIEDKYIIANGLMIEDNGKVLWDKQLDHGYFSSIYLEKPNVLITDRFAMPGPCTVSAGIACIDCNTGEYKWRHFYDNHREERLAFRRREADINIDSGIWILSDEYMIFGKFLVKIEDGSYKYINHEVENMSIYKKAKSECKKKRLENLNNVRDDSISLDVRMAIVNGIRVEKEGYFFNKCSAVINLNDSKYIIASPGKKVKSNNIIFKINLNDNEIEELELPFRGYIEEIYDFFNNGYLVNEVTGNCERNLWYIDKKCLL